LERCLWHRNTVIARHEAIHGPLREDMDCHGAARLAMTDSAVRLTMTQRRHCAPTSSLRPLPRHCEERSNPLQPLCEDMDCHGAARLAMTGLWLRALP
jgi:hypothetical protein